jgi:hypothetical protein
MKFMTILLGLALAFGPAARPVAAEEGRGDEGEEVLAAGEPRSTSKGVWRL